MRKAIDRWRGERDGLAEGQTYAPAIAIDDAVKGAGSFDLHAMRRRDKQRGRRLWGGGAKELSLVSHKLKLVPPHGKLMLN